MVNYARGFNQSETGKYFEWIIRDNTLTLRAFDYWKREALLLITLPSFMTHLTALAIRPPFNRRFLQNGLIEYIWGEVTMDYGILTRNLSKEKLHVFSCRYVIIFFFSFFFFFAIVRRRTVPHADQLRAVSTAWYWLSHGKAWHVLRWRVRFLIRMVLDLTNRFDFSVRLFSYNSQRTSQHTYSSNILTPSMIV